MIRTDRAFRNEVYEWSPLQSGYSDECCNLCYAVWTLCDLLNLSNEQISDYRDPKMCANGIPGIAPQSFYHDVLLYPFEEHLNIPSVTVEVSNLQCADFKVVGDKYYLLPCILILAADCSDRLRVQSECLALGHYDVEIAQNTICIGENLSVTYNGVPHVGLWTTYPVGSCKMEAKQCVKIHVSLGHHVERIRLWNKNVNVELVAIVPSAIRYVNVCRNTATQVEQCMHLHSSFAVLPQCPCRQIYTGGDSCGIESVDYILHGYVRYGTVSIQRPHDTYETLSKFFVDMVVTLLVSSGKVRLRDRISEAEVIEDVLVCLETQTYVPKRIATCNLPEEQMQQLVITTQFFSVPITMVSCHSLIELVSWDIVHDLGEYITTDVHNLAVWGCKDTRSIQIKKSKNALKPLYTKGFPCVY